MNLNSQHLQVRFRGLITPLSIKILQHFITAYCIIRVKRKKDHHKGHYRANRHIYKPSAEKQKHRAAKKTKLCVFGAFCGLVSGMFNHRLHRMYR